MIISILFISFIVIHKNSSMAILLSPRLHVINLLILFLDSHLELGKLYFRGIAIWFRIQDAHVRGLVCLTEHLRVWLIGLVDQRFGC
jgi:hypothetical protein